VRAEVSPLLAGLGAREPTYHWSSSSWPIGALHELAAYEAADLIVFGANLQRALGCLPVSLTERMVHGAPCAVARAPAGYAARERRPPRRIGVGFCDSQEARAALGVAWELAGKLGCELELIAGAGLDPTLASYAFSAPLLAQAESEIHAQTEEQLERAAAELRDGAQLRTRTIAGIPSEVLIERSGDLDLLVLGSRAYGPLRHALLGSVSAPVMREASCRCWCSRAVRAILPTRRRSVNRRPRSGWAPGARCAWGDAGTCAPGAEAA
jgi:nucleotide-binding universal stress UspA family protein